MVCTSQSQSRTESFQFMTHCAPPVCSVFSLDCSTAGRIVEKWLSLRFYYSKKALRWTIEQDWPQTLFRCCTSPFETEQTLRERYKSMQYTKQNWSLPSSSRGNPRTSRSSTSLSLKWAELLYDTTHCGWFAVMQVFDSSIVDLKNLEVPSAPIMKFYFGFYTWLVRQKALIGIFNQLNYYLQSSTDLVYHIKLCLNFSVVDMQTK